MSLKKRVKKQLNRAKDFGTRIGKKAKPYLKAGVSVVGGPFGSALADKWGGREASDEYRAEAVKSIRSTKKQAGSGQIDYNEEVWE